MNSISINRKKVVKKLMSSKYASLNKSKMEAVDNIVKFNEKMEKEAVERSVCNSESTEPIHYQNLGYSRL